MKKFKNKIVGVIEVVTNEEVIKQYLKYNDIYELIEDKKADPTLKELKELFKSSRTVFQSDCLILHSQKCMRISGIPGGSDGKESACNAGDLGSIPWLGKYPGKGKGYPLQYSCLENSKRSLAGYSPRGRKE